MPKKSKKTAPESWIYVPRDFDPDDYPGAIGNHPDAARWLLNCLHFRRVTRHLGHEEYINLHSGLLSLVMGKTEYVKPVRDAMLAHKLIECDGTWSLGAKSLGYRVGQALQGRKWQRYYSADKRFLKRVSKFKEYVANNNSLSSPQHLHLAKWARLVKVHPDHRAVLDDMDEEQRELAQMQVEKIEQGMLHLSVCPYGRFHSNFSSLSRKVRPYLTVNGSPLTEVDLVNSQPYFLTVILMEIALSSSGSNVRSLSDLVFDRMQAEAEGRAIGRREKNQELYVFPFEGAGRRPGGEGEERGAICFPFRRTVLDDLSPDLRQFARTALEGGFYETFQQPGQSDRDMLKQKVFQVLYGSRHCQANAELGPQFRRQYPTAFRMMDDLKKQMGYEWVGRELQRRESNVIINGLAGDMQRDYPHIPIVTVHDSVMTTQEHMPTVKALLRQHLATNYFQPKLKDRPAVSWEEHRRL